MILKKKPSKITIKTLAARPWLWHNNTYVVQRSHGGAGRRNDVVNKEKQGVFRAQVDALSDEKIELADSKIGRYQVLLFVQFTDTRLWGFFDDHLGKQKQTKN